MKYFKPYIFLFFLLSSYSLIGNNTDINDLLKGLEKANYSQQLKLYNQLIEAYSSTNLDSSLYYYDEVFLLTKEKQDFKNMWSTTNILLSILKNKGEYSISKKYLDQSLEIMRQHGNEELIANVLLQLGTFHWSLSNLKEAQTVLNEALFHANQVNNLRLKADILKVFGSMHIDLESYPEGFKYLEEANHIFQEIKDTVGQAKLFNSLGYAHILNKNYNLALQTLNKGIEFSQKMGIQNIYELALANKGDALIGVNQVDSGFAKIEEALQMAITNKNIFNVIVCYEIQTRRLLEIGKYDEVIEASTKGLELCKGTETKKNVHRFCEKIAEAYHAKNDFKQSLTWTEKANESKKELLDLQENKEVLKLHLQHQIQQKEAENEILTLKYKNRTFLIALLIATFIVIAFLMFYFFKKNQEKLIESFKQKIAADLHDDVGGNLNSISRIAKGLKSTNNSEEVNEGIDLLVSKSNTAIKNVVDVIWALDTEENKIGFLIDKMEDSLYGIKQFNKSIKIAFNKDNINEDKKLPIDVRHNLLMIFKEAINNIQKHTTPESINITLKNSSQQFQMQIVNSFEEKKSISASNGRGILNIKRRVKDMNGTVDIKETKNSFSLNIDLGIVN